MVARTEYPFSRLEHALVPDDVLHDFLNLRAWRQVR